jgi:hypothetical protein
MEVEIESLRPDPGKQPDAPYLNQLGRLPLDPMECARTAPILREND